MYSLPEMVEVEGRQYKIRDRGDYRMVLDAFSALEDVELDKNERLICALLIFYEDFDTIEDVLSNDDVEYLASEMFSFFNAGRPEGPGNERKLIDWQNDSAMIFSAVNQVSGKELRSEPYVHWWTFSGYYSSIGESTLSTVVQLREKIVKGETLDKWERKFRNENPQYFVWNSKTAEDIENEQWVKSLWNKE